MELSLRPFATAGVALTAAGVIAAAPVAPPTPEIHTAAPHVVSEAVQLSAVIDPVTALLDLVNHTVTNLGGLATQATSSPQGLFPILQQFLANQVTYAQDIGGGFLTGAASALNILLTQSPLSFQQALQDLLALQFTNAAIGFYNGVTVPITAFLSHVFAGFGAAATVMLTHAANLAAALVSPVGILWYSYVGFIRDPVFIPLFATTAALDNVVAALNPFNPVGLVSAVLAAPIIITDGLLNGVPGVVVAAGLLTPSPPALVPGPISATLRIRDLIAAAIDPPPANATPKTPAKTVALTTAGITTGTKLTTGATTHPANATALGAPGKSANVKVGNAGGLSLTHPTGKTTRK